MSRRTDLNVAVFAYLPDASTAIEKIEEAFENQYKSIDLDLELWNPYDDKREDDGLEQIGKFDVVEIDVCRIDQLIGGAFGGLDAIPAELRGVPDDFVGGAAAVAKSDAGKYVVPHWVCGNFLVFRADNDAVRKAKSFDDFLAAVDPNASRPLLAAMWGSTGLGEIYADAMIDIHGVKQARIHLLRLGKDHDESVKLDPDALAAVMKLADELTSVNRNNLSHFYNHSYVFPRQFANQRNAVLFGYSERLYYAERELQLTPEKYPPILAADGIVVRQFSFGAKSRGTPSWVDGFVVPQGRLARNRTAIAAFLEFVQSNDAYLAFAEPAPYLAASYLLPAKASAYDCEEIVAKQPVLPQFRKQLDASFPVAQSDLWQGIRAAGSRLKLHLKPE
ncbi:MAG: hypothetical protein DWQ31_17715 [Planctomycetota bacterium]|nr:MAG: hypothetical protein DWQ31_17715 [Planctomycetota bacterium]REJ96813.1 MAG: hypothetical protein DWQ35_03355 [Planctomycetota bacterium]REK24004.1 MAG: hypothetical protein DWQ42_13680 [Planctomycetota bacterium]REK39335.1 MAG: hypothetical protein DWQ46_18835 [Planctomycetota bacterium]